MNEPRFERLAPDRGMTTAREALATIGPGERAPAHRPFVMLNMVTTVDGRATVAGRSGSIGGVGDKAMFGELRCVCDAVLIGTGTLRAEGYGRLVRDPGRRAWRAAAGLAEDPVAVLFSRALDLPWNAPLFDVPEQKVIVACREDAPEPPATGASLTLVRFADPSLALFLGALRSSFGVRSLLCEGGPTLNGVLLAEGLLDELFLTLGPQLAGDSGALGLLEGPLLDKPAGLAIRWVLRHGDELFLRYALR